jgi:hypothetical protein
VDPEVYVPKLRQIFSPHNPAVRRTFMIGGVFILGFIVLGVISIQVWEYSNSVAFCSDTCHNVHPEEPSAFQDSLHARVRCTECHMGRLGTMQSIVVKATHFRHLPAVLLNRYGRPTESESMRPANESCERCHWPPAFHGDRVQEITHYLPDEENTEKRTYLILKTGAGGRETGLGFGIHWHITNPIEYIATDEHKQEIRWVRATLPDGRTVEYSDVTNPMTPEEFVDAKPKVMDCVDCHNRIGHPFPYPEQATDDALAEGRLNPALPFARKEMVDLLSAPYPDQEAALEAIETVRARYETTYPDVAASYPDAIDQAAETAQDLIKRIVFERLGVTWESFPDNAQHKEFAGCFRCHDGKHISPEGESIRLHCNICHSIPVTVGEGDRPPEKPVVYLQEPASHLDANFMADHRFQANGECVECHGEIEFGSDDSSFCANSACHGQAWPEVELDAAFQHPIELTGAHAEVWCHDCHEGVKKPEFECVNCHEPPVEPHFGQTCEDCHTPEGFHPADMGAFEHPVPLEGNHATLDCLACHSAGLDLTYECAACHEAPTDPHFGETCQDCHTPDGFKPARMGSFEHPVSLEGEHATLDCLDCHTAGPDLTYECAACHQPPQDHFELTCDACHNPQGWAESVTSITSRSPGIPHTLVGLSDCLLCHSPEGRAVPAPDDHAGFVSEQCLICHKPVP